MILIIINFSPPMRLEYGNNFWDMWAFTAIHQFLSPVLQGLYLLSSKNHAIQTRHSVEVGTEALVEETKYNKSFFYWHGVVRAIARPGFIAIYVTQHMALIIPNRAFASPRDRATLLAVVKTKIQSAAKGSSQ